MRTTQGHDETDRHIAVEGRNHACGDHIHEIPDPESSHAERFSILIRLAHAMQWSEQHPGVAHFPPCGRGT